MKVNGARVNPYAMLELPFPRNGSIPEPVLASPSVPAKEESTPTATGGDGR